MTNTSRVLFAAACIQAAPAAGLGHERIAQLLTMQTRVGPGDVALTFDDGPHPEGTPAVLETLAALDVPATFFLSGEQVVRLPELAAEIAARGHGVGVHGHRHVVLSLRSPRGTADDLRRAREEIGRATRSSPALFRPPYGVATPASLIAARRSGMRTVLWSRWGRDWTEDVTPASVAALATRELRGGEIVLLHDADHYAVPGSWQATVAALPRIVDAVRERSLRLVRL